MQKIVLNHVSKQYVVNKNDSFYALKSISLSFESTGFVSIIGKSGSGKSTILNLIGGLDTPTSGNITFNNKDMSKLKGKKKTDFYKKEISILFQNCNLIEDQDVFFNISLPLYIKGIKDSEIKQKTNELIKRVGLNDELTKKKVSVLSGGEKQRVALARALISDSGVLLCDEPTGALDSKNSTLVMEILKEYSKNHLVIMASHNLPLVEKYSDRIIEIAEGTLIRDQLLNNAKIEAIVHKQKNKKSTRWINNISLKNIKKRFFRNLFSFFALSISLLSSFLAIGFINGKDTSINELSLKQFDFGVATVQKEEKISSESIFSLSRSTRPSLKSLQNNAFLMDNFALYPNYDALLMSNSKISSDGLDLDNISIQPIETFLYSSVDYSLLSKGTFPTKDTLSEVVVNQKGYEYLSKELGGDPINKIFNFKNTTRYKYIDNDETIVEDYFSIDINFTIKGVVKEMNYLQNPKIYYSYLALDDYLSTVRVDNLSTYKKDNITWKELVETAENFDAITSYSYRLFLKDISNSNVLLEDIKLEDDLVLTSPALLVRSSLVNFMDVAQYGLTAFLIVSLIGTASIMSIMAFASYSEDHKMSAILTCLGANNDEIYEIYLNESLLTGFVSLLFSFGLSFFLTTLVNNLIYQIVELKNLIVIPLYSFLNIPYLFPLISIVITILLCFISTIIPILFSKHIVLKEELQSL